LASARSYENLKWVVTPPFGRPSATSHCANSVTLPVMVNFAPGPRRAPLPPAAVFQYTNWPPGKLRFPVLPRTVT